MAQPSGFAQLGNVLGGGIDREGAYLEGRYTGARTQDAISRARLNQARAMSEKQKIDANTALAEGLVSGFDFDPEQASGLATALTSGSGNIQQVMQALQGRQELGARQALFDDPAADVGQINRTRAILGESAFEPGQVEGGMLFNNLAGDPVATAQVTPGEQASIRQRTAAADLSDARREWGPNKGVEINLGSALAGRPQPESVLNMTPEGAVASVGLEGAFLNAANAAAGAVGLNMPAPEAHEARQSVQQMGERTRAAGRALLNMTGRPSNLQLQMGGVFVVDPTRIMMGDEQALSRATSTLRAFERKKEELEYLVNNDVLGGTAATDKAVQQLLAIDAAIADHRDLIQTFGEGRRQRAAPETVPETTPEAEVPPAPEVVDPEAWSLMNEQERARVLEILGGAQ